MTALGQEISDIINKLLEVITIFPILYAEIHYTLKGFSIVYRKWPEILSDVPYRIEPAQSIPLLVIIKDAHKYPVVLLSVRVEIKYPDNTIEIHQLVQDVGCIEEPLWFRTETIQPRKGFFGTLEIDVIFNVKRQGKEKSHTFHVDNYIGSSHSPLKVFIAKQTFPKFENWYYGDLHYHSFFTHDQVEFGGPIEATAEIAESMGISFLAVTDHAYDLDDSEDDYLHNDPNLPKWHRLYEHIERVKREKKFVFIPGEEVSCGNERGKNIHLLLFNNRRFFSGSGDSAEHWFKTKPEHSLVEILDNLEEKSLAFAAHPEVSFPLLQWLFLRRGKWTKTDYEHPRLTGLQILNGSEDTAFYHGIRQWIRLLLQGRKLSLIAGNDAHGSFNRYRQLGLPFLYLEELQVHIFGRVRTGLFIIGKPNRSKILQALVKGQSYITTGPALVIEFLNNKGKQDVLSDSTGGNHFDLIVKGKTSEEFGDFRTCKIWIGDLAEKKERLLKEIDQFEKNCQFKFTFNFEKISSPFYIRGELKTEKNNQTFLCMTNPIWINY